ncbi:MAG: PD40 domain-containing protein [Saprospiraceae bacterium]|nr:PD40 domain-containing protein [Saprospiraceae bacterium]
MTKKMYNPFLMLLLLTAEMLYSQVTTSGQLSTKDNKLYIEAKKLTLQGDLNKSNKKYEELLKANPFFIEGILRLATNYHSVKEYKKSEILFKEAIKKAPDFDSEMYYSLAMVLRDQQKNGEAVNQLENYIEKEKKNPLKVKKAKFISEELKFREYAYKNPVPFISKRLDENINTKQSEYSPSLSLDDSGMIFTRNNGQEDLYFVKKDSTGKYMVATPNIGLNTTQNEGAHTMSADGRFLVFTACDRRDSYGSCDLYSATILDGKWTKPVNMGQKVNNVGWDSQPQLTPDGRTLYFSSKRKENIGGADIWMTWRDEKNAWVTPVNLGPNINTEGNDETPFLHPDGQTIYFRTDGRPGMGSFDIYYSRKEFLTGQWQTPINIGYPINTENQEGGLLVSLDGQKAYYASDIDPHTGKSTGNLDIYSFDLYEKARPQPSVFVKGNITDAITGKAIDVLVSIIEIVSGEKTFMLKTDMDGTFLTSVSAKKMYACVVQKAGYRYYTRNFDLRQITNFTEPFILDVQLTPESKMTDTQPVILQNIFFKTGSSELLPESSTEIDLLYQLLLKNPSVGIRITGHTDNVGSDTDNLKLSTTRAQAVVSALVNKGIPKEKLKAEGKGESMPIDTNDTEAGRQRNRRTEFVVFKKNE